MAQTLVVKVTVQELTKYGFKANDKYVGLSKQLSEADKSKLVPGASFEAEYYISDGGKEYLNKIVKMLEAPVAAPKAEVKTFKPKFEKKADAISAGLSKDEWRLKDERISRQGVIQVAVQVMADFDKAMELADKMLVYVNRNTPKSQD